jgi:hypothetical protein
MPKKIAAPSKLQTHFEQVPVEVVVKVAEIDTPLELTPAPSQPANPLTPRKLQRRATDSGKKKER